MSNEWGLIHGEAKMQQRLKLETVEKVLGGELNKHEATRELAEYINDYNHRRIKPKLKGTSPVEY